MKLDPEVGMELKVGDTVIAKTYDKLVSRRHRLLHPLPGRQIREEAAAVEAAEVKRRASAAECEKNYVSIRKLKQGASGDAFAAISATLAVAAGCDAGRVNKALTGTGGRRGGSSSGGGGYTKVCKWESGVGSNVFGTGAGGGWDCTCDVNVVDGEHYCGGKPYPSDEGQSTETRRSSSSNRAPGVDCKWEDVPIQSFGMEGANPWTCMCRIGDPAPGQCGQAPKWP